MFVWLRSTGRGLELLGGPEDLPAQWKPAAARLEQDGDGVVLRAAGLPDIPLSVRRGVHSVAREWHEESQST